MCKLTRRGDRVTGLSPTEFRLLAYLMLHQGRVLSKAQSLEQLWQCDFRGDNVVERFVSNLRREIDVSAHRRAWVAGPTRPSPSAYLGGRGSHRADN